MKKLGYIFILMGLLPALLAMFIIITRTATQDLGALIAGIICALFVITGSKLID